MAVRCLCCCILGKYELFKFLLRNKVKSYLKNENSCQNFDKN